MELFLRILYVFVMGGLGSLTRYGVQFLLRVPPDHLNGLYTLIVNVLGCFLMGFFAGWMLVANWSHPHKVDWALLTMTGYCGGLSTFSAFTFDCLQYFEAGKLLHWIVFAALTIVGGLSACALGYWLGKKM